MILTKRIKTIFSLLLCLSVLLTISVPGAVADTLPGTVSLVEAENAYNFLKAVGAVDKNEVPFNPSFVVTRAHFVKLAMHLSNDAPKVITSAEDIFTDVNSSTEYEGYIETACRIGYISGSGSGTFEPEQPISLVQAIKIIINILGYGNYAENMGGYPTGYLVMAQKTDLLSGIDTDSNSLLDMPTAMLLLKNAANAEIMQFVSFSGDSIELKSTSGQTLLYKNHGVDYIDGIMNANAYTDLLSQESLLLKNQVSVSDVIFETEDKNIHSYLGCRVKLYFSTKTNSSVKKALYAELSDTNTIIEAQPENIELSNGQLQISEDDRNIKKISLSPTVSYILNGKMTIMSPDDILSVQKGSVKFISNDGDKITDVISITKYITSVVNGVSSSSGIVVTDDGSRIYLDSESEEYSFNISKNGKTANINDISVGDVILVSEGSGEGYHHSEVLVSNEKLSTSVDEIGDGYIIAGKEKYNIDSGIADKITLGCTHTISFDAFGNISHIYAENDFVYGFLYALAKQGMDKPQCRIFTENGRWVELSFADRVKYNGSYVSAENLYKLLYDSGDEYKKLVRYNVNSVPELIRLESYSEILIGDEAEMDAIKNDTFRLSYSGNLYYRNSPKSFNGVFFIDPNAIIFNIPQNLSEENFKVRSVSSLRTDNRYDIKAYNVDKYLTSKLLTTYGLGADRDITNTDKFMIVSGLGRVVNSEGDDVPSLRGWWNDSEISLPVKVSEDGISSETLNNLQKGDVILFKYDEDSNVISITEYPADSKYYTSSSILYSTCTIIGGDVSEIDITNKKIRIRYNAEGSEAGVIYTSATTATIWDKKTGEMRPADVSEIIPGDAVFVNTRYLSCYDIIIIRQ